MAGNGAVGVGVFRYPHPPTPTNTIPGTPSQRLTPSLTTMPGVASPSSSGDELSGEEIIMVAAMAPATPLAATRTPPATFTTATATDGSYADSDGDGNGGRAPQASVATDVGVDVDAYVATSQLRVLLACLPPSLSPSLSPLAL